MRDEIPGGKILEFAAAEEVVLISPRAVRAPQARDEQDGDAHRYHNGEHTPVRHQPMNQAFHSGALIKFDSETDRGLASQTLARVSKCRNSRRTKSIIADFFEIPPCF